MDWQATRLRAGYDIAKPLFWRAFFLLQGVSEQGRREFVCAGLSTQDTSRAGRDLRAGLRCANAVAL